MALDLGRIDRMDGRINQRGADLFFDELARRYGAEHGIDDFLVLYGAGRAGAMGDVGVHQVQSAFAYFEPGLVAQMWSRLDPAQPPSAVAQVFAAALAAVARERWDDAAASTVHRIGRQVADGVTALGLPLFAGWRAMPVPDDALGAAALTVMTLRELRGDVHVQSVAASGVGPLEADLATRGEEGARMHGWQSPFPDVSAHAEAVAAARAATSQRMGRIYAETIGEATLAELHDAVSNLRRA